MKVIACYSNKGGVGKTAAAVNLAYAMTADGYRVLLCDLDPQAASSFYFRIKPSKKLSEKAFFKDVEKFTGAIRGSDFDDLDIPPANLNFRDFDVFLSRLRDRRSRLKKALKAVKGDYDVVVLDCPPSMSTLSENVFRSSDAVLVPVIPTTLSHRSFEQLVDLFKQNKLPVQKLHAFFSMVQSVKTLHADTMSTLNAMFRKRFSESRIPFASDIERMGVVRAPVLVTAPQSAAGKAYQALSDEVIAKIIC